MKYSPDLVRATWYVQTNARSFAIDKVDKGRVYCVRMLRMLSKSDGHTAVKVRDRAGTEEVRL